MIKDRKKFLNKVAVDKQLYDKKTGRYKVAFVALIIALAIVIAFA